MLLPTGKNQYKNMEQALINQLIKLLCKSGCESFVGNFQRDLNEKGIFEEWSTQEIEEAVNYITYINECFGRNEAVAIITNLAARYNIDTNDMLKIKPRGLVSE
jgi:hypothetical protein